MKAVVLASVLFLSACGTVRYQSCPDARLPAEPFPDTKDAIAKVPPGDIVALVKLMEKGKAARDERLSEDNDQISACAAPLPKKQ